MGLNAFGFIQLATVASLTHIVAFIIVSEFEWYEWMELCKRCWLKTAIIRCAFLKICDDTIFQRCLRNNWLLAETWWVEAFTISNLIDQTLMSSSIRVGTFNAAMGRSWGDLMAKWYRAMIGDWQGESNPLSSACSELEGGSVGIAKNVFNIPSCSSIYQAGRPQMNYRSHILPSASLPWNQPYVHTCCGLSPDSWLLRYVDMSYQRDQENEIFSYL